MTPRGQKSRSKPNPPRNVYRKTEPGLARRTRGMPAAPVACDRKTECGACRYVNLDYKQGLQEKFVAGKAQLDEAKLLSKGHVLNPVASPHPLEYRSHFKLAVRPFHEPVAKQRIITTREGVELPPRRFTIGLFQPGTHHVVGMRECPLHTYPLKKLIRDLEAELDASPLTPYNEETHSGDIRYVSARAAHLTGEIMLTFVVTKPLKVELKRLVGQLQRRGSKINSAHMNIHTEQNNAIFGDKTEPLAGSTGLRERLCDLDFEVSPTSFFQINPWQAINLYRRVESVVGEARPGSVAWDLFSGTGQFSLILARLGFRVLGIEENQAAIADAAANAKKNKLADKTEFLASRVEDSTHLIPLWAKAPDVVIVNPSRRGLQESSRKFIGELLRKHPQTRFIYVSCEVATLTRDLKEIVELSGFSVRQLEPFDMFPQTDNMEWLAVLSQQS